MEMFFYGMLVAYAPALLILTALVFAIVWKKLAAVRRKLRPIILKERD